MPDLWYWVLNNYKCIISVKHVVYSLSVYQRDSMRCYCHEPMQSPVHCHCFGLWWIWCVTNVLRIIHYVIPANVGCSSSLTTRYKTVGDTEVGIDTVFSNTLRVVAYIAYILSTSEDLFAPNDDTMCMSVAIRPIEHRCWVDLARETVLADRRHLIEPLYSKWLVCFYLWWVDIHSGLDGNFPAE